MVERAVLGGGKVETDVAQRVSGGAAAGAVEVRGVETDEAVGRGVVGDDLAAASAHGDGDGTVEADAVRVIAGKGDGNGARVARGGDKGEIGNGGGAAAVVVRAGGCPVAGGAVVIIVQDSRAGGGQAGKADVVQGPAGDVLPGVVEVPGGEGDGLALGGVVVHGSRAVVHMEDEIAGEGGPGGAGAGEGDGDGASVIGGGHKGDVGDPGRGVPVVVLVRGNLPAGTAVVVQVEGPGAGGGQAGKADVVQRPPGGPLAGVVEVAAVQAPALVPANGVLHITAALSIGPVDPDADRAAVGRAGAVGAAVGNVHVPGVALGGDEGDIVDGGAAGSVVAGGGVHLGGVLPGGAVVIVERAPAGGGQAEGDIADGPAGAALADGGEMLRGEGNGLVHGGGVAHVPGGRGLNADGAGEGGPDGGDGVVVHHGDAVKARQGDEGHVPQGHLALAGGLVVVALRAAHAVARGFGGGVLVIEHAVLGGDFQAVYAVQGPAGLVPGAAVQLAQDAGEGVGGLGAHVDGDGLGHVLLHVHLEAGAVAGPGHGGPDLRARSGVISGDPAVDNLGQGVVGALPVDGLVPGVAKGLRQDQDVPVLEDFHDGVLRKLDGLALAAGGSFFHIAQLDAGDFNVPLGVLRRVTPGGGPDGGFAGGHASDLSGFGVYLGDALVAGGPDEPAVVLRRVLGIGGGVQDEGGAGVQVLICCCVGAVDQDLPDAGGLGLADPDDADAGDGGVLQPRLHVEDGSRLGALKDGDRGLPSAGGTEHDLVVEAYPPDAAGRGVLDQGGQLDRPPGGDGGGVGVDFKGGGGLGRRGRGDRDGATRGNVGAVFRCGGDLSGPRR